MLVRNLPHESVCASIERGGDPHWTITDHLLDELRMALTSTRDKPAKPHPERFKQAKRRSAPERLRKLDGARKRKAIRDAAVARGDIT